MKSGNYCSKGVQKVARTLQDLLTISTPQIVIAEHHDGDFGQIRPEHPLATGIIETMVQNPQPSSPS